MTCDPKRYFPPESRDLRGESISPQESYFLHRNRYTFPDCKIFFFFLHHHFLGFCWPTPKILAADDGQSAVAVETGNGCPASAWQLCRKHRAVYGCYGGLLQYRMFIAEDLLETV
jgi:hypothetical protein